MWFVLACYLRRAGVGLRIVRASNRFGSSRWVTLWRFLEQVGSKSCSFTRVTLKFVLASLSCGHRLEAGKGVDAEGFASKFIFVLVRKGSNVEGGVLKKRFVYESVFVGRASIWRALRSLGFRWSG